MINLSQWQKNNKNNNKERKKEKKKLETRALNINLATSGERRLLLPVPLLPTVRTSRSQQDAWL